MINFVIGILSGIVIGCIVAYFTYLMGKKTNEKKVKALEDIAKGQKDYIRVLEADFQYKQKVFEYQKQKDIVAVLWEGYKYFSGDE